MLKKTATVHARVPDDLRKRLDAIHKAHLTNDSAVTVHMLEAFCEYVEKMGSVKLPIQIIPALPVSEASKPAKKSA